MIGNGNVAIDCARMLALTPEELAPTDTTHEAIDAINGAGVREILMLGRRGPVQAAFTPPELKELGELAGADVDRRPRRPRARRRRASASSRPTASARAATSSCCEEYAAREPAGKPRRIVLRFLVSPLAILGDERVEAIEIVRNELVEEDGRIVARPTGETEVDPVRASSCAASATRASRCRACRSTSAAGRSRTTRGRVAGAERTYAPAGSSAARAA